MTSLLPSTSLGYGDAWSGLYRISGLQGVYASTPDVVLNAGLKAFLKKLRRLVSFDLVVNSGVRTVSGQASAMWNNFQKYGGDYIRRQYGSKVEGIQNVTSLAGMVAFVADLARRGILVSDHMTGRALDFRVRHLSSSQVSALTDAVDSMKSVEPDLRLVPEPDHYHLEGIGGGFLTSPWVWVSAGLGIVGIAWAIKRAGWIR